MTTYLKKDPQDLKKSFRFGFLRILVSLEGKMRNYLSFFKVHFCQMTVWNAMSNKMNPLIFLVCKSFEPPWNTIPTRINFQHYCFHIIFDVMLYNGVKWFLKLCKCAINIKWYGQTIFETEWFFNLFWRFIRSNTLEHRTIKIGKNYIIIGIQKSEGKVRIFFF